MDIYGDRIVTGVNTPIKLWNLVWNFRIVLYINSRFLAFNIKIGQIEGSKFNSIATLPMINNLLPYAKFDLRVSFENSIECTYLEADNLYKGSEILDGLNMKMI